ncbi:Ribokinase [Pleurostoma richardsiae]|uniref:Ribokinase n=1 Tax=Pleurostoma richardsiae TaxID=41990 RepID=A0AA38VJY3_9PEZI|nr:Ribokinase [Pleurostoma richardsiae]
MTSQASKPVLAVIGSLNIDLVTYTPRIPDGGETMTASSFHVGLGGKGANQAVACAKLSRSKSALDAGTATVKMVGAVGDDAYGGMMTTGLRDFGVDVSGVETRRGMKTGVAVILVEETTGENRILLSPEANHSLLPEHFRELPSPLPDLIIMQLEIPLETVLQILDTAHKKGVPVLLNPAPAQKIPAEYYKSISHFVVNETEALFMSDCDESELETEAGLGKIAGVFKSKGAENVLITLGGKGVYYSGSDGRSGLVPAEKAKVVDTTAAGDTFVGTYALEAVTKAAGFDMEKAVRAANRAAARTVEKKGAQESIPWLDELSP